MKNEMKDVSCWEWLQKEYGLTQHQFCDRLPDQEQIDLVDKNTGNYFEDPEEAFAYFGGYTEGIIREYESLTGNKWGYEPGEIDLEENEEEQNKPYYVVIKASKGESVAGWNVNDLDELKYFAEQWFMNPGNYKYVMKCKGTGNQTSLTWNKIIDATSGQTKVCRIDELKGYYVISNLEWKLIGESLVISNDEIGVRTTYEKISDIEVSITMEVMK